MTEEKISLSYATASSLELDSRSPATTTGDHVLSFPDETDPLVQEVAERTSEEIHKHSDATSLEPPLESAATATAPRTHSGISSPELDSPSREPTDREFLPAPTEPLSPDLALVLQEIISKFSRTALALRNRTISPPEFYEIIGQHLRDLLDAARLAEHYEAIALWVAETQPQVNFLVAFAEYCWSLGKIQLASLLAGRAYSIDSRDLYTSGLVRKYQRAALGLPDELGQDARFCRNPFEVFEIAQDGNVHLCCPNWLPKSIGNVYLQNWADIWNSPIAQDIRASIHDGSYRYCNKINCPALGAGGLPKKTEITDARMAPIIAKKQTTLMTGPKFVNLAHEPSCNLECPSCRKGIYVANSAEKDYLKKLADNVILPLLENVEVACMTGSGDPFASHHFRYLLKKTADVKYSHLAITLQTNGVLFDERAWRELALDGRVNDVFISLDACTEEIYNIVRKGGNFSRLMRNLKFISALRRDGRIASLRLDFVVQQTNYRDMPGFVEIAQSIGADGVAFTPITNWHWSDAEFRDHAIWSSSHPEYQDFQKVLESPVLRWSQINWGGLTGVAQAVGAAIENVEAAEYTDSPELEVE